MKHECRFAELAMNEPRGTLVAAMGVERRSGQMIGRVSRDFCDYHTGDFVIVEQYDKPNGLCTVEMPMTAAMIDNEKKSGSLLTTWLTVMNVPLSYIELVQQPNHHPAAKE